MEFESINDRALGSDSAVRNESVIFFKFVSRKHVQLLILFAAYILSNIFRTLPAVLAPSITQNFALSIESAGYFLAAFNFAFGGMQLVVGVTIDRYGSMRSVACLLLFACAGALLSCFAHSFAVLLAGQVLIGVGCSAIFLACLVFLSKHFPPHRFAGLSGLALGLGGCGMLLTATPLAMVVEAWSWRGAFFIVTFASILVTAACFTLFEQSNLSRVRASETIVASFRLVGSLLWRRGTLGILLMGSVGYAAMISVRGFWIVPLLLERNGLTLIQSGNVVLLLSIGMTLSPFLYGLMDPGGKARRNLIVASALAMSAAIIWLGFSHSETLAPTLVSVAVIGAVSGFTILQYADVRSSYEPGVIGRALSLLNMSVFIGAAMVQMLTGFVSDASASLGTNSIQNVFLTLALVVTVGCFAFKLLPAPRRPD